jgi:hypothetical protein
MEYGYLVKKAKKSGQRLRRFEVVYQRRHDGHENGPKFQKVLNHF